MSAPNPGVSREDLEKAASVRLFEKVAAANDIDLNTLDGAQINALYGDFEANVLPRLTASPEKLAEMNAADVQAKLAGLTQDQAVELFEKQAAAEGIDLDALDDGQIKQAFEYFVPNVLPLMAEQDFAVITPAQAQKIAAVQEAQVKLAEAEALGRHMARAYHDESQKLASVASVGARVADTAERVGLHGANMAFEHPKKALGALAAGATAAGAGGVAAGRMSKKASVTLNPDDVEVLQKLAESGDLEGFRNATAAISKAAGFVPFGKKDGDDKDKEDEGSKKDAKEDKKEDKEKKEDEKDASAPFSALDLLVEQRATEIARDYLIKTGALKE